MKEPNAEYHQFSSVAAAGPDAVIFAGSGMDNKEIRQTAFIFFSDNHQEISTTRGSAF